MNTSEAGFTKGPWHYHARLSGSENHRGFRVYGASQWVFCEVQPGDEDGREGEANARLIVAAPDLLAALIEMEREKSDYMTRNKLGDPAEEHTNKMARDAINKALGK